MAQAGEIGYPEYMADGYTEYMYGANDSGASPFEDATQLTTDIGAQVNFLVTSGQNPYKLADSISSENTSIKAQSPDALLALYEQRIDTFIGKIEELDAEGKWTDYANTAAGLVDGILAETADEDADLAQFEDGSLHNLAESYNRLNAAMFDINGVVGTTLPNGQALLEARFNTDIARYKTERRTGRNRERAVFILQSIQEMSSMNALRLNGEGNIINVRDQFTKIKIAFKDSEKRQNIDYDRLEKNWEMDELIKGGSMLNALQGISPVPERLTDAQQLLSNAAGAAAFGLTVGGATGSVGAGVVSGIAALVFGNAASGVGRFAEG